MTRPCILSIYNKQLHGNCVNFITVRNVILELISVLKSYWITVPWQLTIVSKCPVTKLVSCSRYNPKLAVMVWIHGGAFAVGSGNSFLYGPDHLVGAGVVLITLNYRLGALGFLSLENEEVSGNMGLKVCRSSHT